MSFKSKIIIGFVSLLVGAISAVAMADEGASSSASGTEFFHQTAADKWEVTPMLDYHDWSTKFNSSVFDTKWENTGEDVSVKGEYGINEMFSVGAKLGYTTESNKITTSESGVTYGNGTNSGLNNFDIYGLGHSAMGPGTLHYGLDLALSMAKHTITINGTQANPTEKTNEDTGGTSLTPSVGYDMSMGPGMIGTKLSYSFLLSNRSLSSTDNTGGNQTGTESESGGNLVAWSVFYEYAMAPWTLGLSVTWNSVNSNTDTPNGGTATKNDSGHSGLMFNIYAPVVVAENITLLPNIGFGDPGTVLVGQSGVSGYSGWQIGVGARFAF